MFFPVAFLLSFIAPQSIIRAAQSFPPTSEEVEKLNAHNYTSIQTYVSQSQMPSMCEMGVTPLEVSLFLKCVSNASACRVGTLSFIFPGGPSDHHHTVPKTPFQVWCETILRKMPGSARMEL